jgi:hypothetical protein
MARYAARPLDEPLTISADSIAEFLDRYRKHDMADFVRHLGRRVQQDNKRWMDAVARINELEAKYEPRVREKAHDPQPKPESSD